MQMLLQPRRGKIATYLIQHIVSSDFIEEKLALRFVIDVTKDQLRGPRPLRQEWFMDAIEALAIGDQMLAD